MDNNKTKDTKQVHYLTEEEYATTLNQELTEVATSAPLKVLKFTRKTSVTRQQVVNAFQNSFEMIGGVDRLALWADQNPGEFFKLFAKLLPQSSADILNGNREFIVRHVLPKPNLPEFIDAEFEEVVKSK